MTLSIHFGAIYFAFASRFQQSVRWVIASEGKHLQYMELWPLENLGSRQYLTERIWVSY